MPAKINIALIGAGRSGTPLLQELAKFEFINIVGVADLNAGAEGISIARDMGIYTTDTPMQLIEKNEQIDILVEVTGDPNMKRQIKDYFDETGNRKTIIMHDLISRMLISVCTGDQDLAPSFHPNDVGIG
jgi:predicted homoserine dehydrogenase-like protein